MKILKILWCILRRDEFIFYSTRMNSLLYKMPEKDLKDILQDMSVKAVDRYYKKYLI